MKNNISEQFKNWGEKKRAVPANQEAMRAKVLSALRPGEPRSFYQRPPARFWKWSFAVVAIVLLVFFVPGIYKMYQRNAVRNDYSFDVGFGGGTPGVAMQAAVEQESLGLSYGADTGLGEKESRSVVAKISNYFADRSVDDTREFMQTDYSATIKTRQVQKLSQATEMAVRGLGGRIDNANVATKYANISFVIPKASLGQFKEEINGMAPARFIEEYEGNTNLLDKKQTVEQQTETANRDLIARQKEKQDLIDRHNDTLGRLQSQYDYATLKIQELSRIYTTDTVYRASLDASIAKYKKDQTDARKTIANENNEYKTFLAVADNNITQTNAELNNLGQQNEAILDTVATVRGTVAFRWISVPGMIDLYVPLRWAIPITLILLVICGFLFRREKGFDLP